MILGLAGAITDEPWNRERKRARPPQPRAHLDRAPGAARARAAARRAREAPRQLRLREVQAEPVQRSFHLGARPQRQRAQRGLHLVLAEAVPRNVETRGAACAA